ncbi:MAG: regulatory protein RecX [Flavobacteriales bacterium]|nr:regulatory protein RecX [Flavobacteriales bacterium]
MAKLMRYCAFQERSSKDVFNKLSTFTNESAQIQLIYNYLIQHNYLNDQRFACSFASGKFRMNKWGRIKIKMGLINKGVDSKLIDEALEQISEEDYSKTLYHLAVNKMKLIKAKNDFELKIKLKRYLANKGYEADKVNQVIESINKH